MSKFFINLHSTFNSKDFIQSWNSIANYLKIQTNIKKSYPINADLLDKFFSEAFNSHTEQVYQNYMYNDQNLWRYSWLLILK